MKLTGIKTAIATYKEYANERDRVGNLRYTTQIFCDTEDGSVWTDVELAPSWTEYQNSAIREICPSDIIYRYGKVNMSTLKKYIEEEL